MTLSRRDFIRLGVVTGALAISGPSLGQPLLHAPVAELPPHILSQAMDAFARHRTNLVHTDRIGVVDFSRPSSAPRLFVVDLASGTAQAHLVAHGRGSDPAHTGWTRRFSNESGSFASSAGSFVTGAEYRGHQGRSMRLVGLDAENCNAESRAIVVHAAWYVSPEIATLTGMLGRSEGCFAVSSASLDHVLDRLGPGRLLFAARGQG
ncbi:murein L,D-transpeptidase catalytic domain-containing protein [Sphingomonas sp.]|uniref:murein L,D-transpeptidase catalytic domain-containing protein n=1 Tax=Sphingomonas sp. TaxID=28214 RepID=UPI0025E7F289|nr:murein L,D-transpeptidase catalytic domain family protein [Sphingomonas sp.]